MSEVEDLLNSIKDCWPKFSISKENLLRPSQEVVIRFYTMFIEDYNEKVAYLTGVPTTFDFNAADYEPEERLFIQLSRILGKIDGLKFTLADIYQPTHMRTKSFFRVCIHFTAFTEYVQNETETLVNTVFKAKEDSTKHLREQQELIDEINKNAQHKVALSEGKSLLQENLKSTKNAYKEMNAQKAAKESLYTKKRNQIENFKLQLKNKECELKRLKDMEKKLLEQRITDSEYQNILQRLKSLKSQSDILDSEDVDIGDGLVHENKVVQHIVDCIEVLNKLHCNVENVNKFIQEEDKLKTTLNNLEKLTKSKLNPLKQQKIDGEQKLATLQKQLANLQSEYKTVTDNYTTSLIQFRQELATFKAKVDNESKNNSNIILEYKKQMGGLENDLDRLKKTFTTEYVKVSKEEKIAVDKFKDMLIKCKQMEK